MGGYGGSEGEEEEEWWEEGGEDEEAAYHPGAHGKNAAHAPQPNQAEEGAVFFRVLFGENEDRVGGMIDQSMIHRCEREVGKKVCMSYVGFFGWLKKQVKSGWHYLKKAAKSAWSAIKTSVVETYHKLGYGDLVCYQTGCADAVMFIWDSYECAIGDSCEALGDDLGEYLPEKN